MKNIRYTWLLMLALAGLGCSEQDKMVEFGLDSERIAIGPEGGVNRIRINSADQWVATTDNPWITVSPANGHGSVECEIIIDSALTVDARRGSVRIQTLSSEWESREVVVEQEGFPYAITLAEPEVKVEDYAAYDERTFEVKVLSNVDFKVEIPDNAGWLKHEDYKVSLDRGVRPREVTVRFNWRVNSMPQERLAEVRFVPREEVTLAMQQNLQVRQGAAAPIEEETRPGDSVALLGVARGLDMWYEWDNSQPMDNWDGVQLWDEGMEGYTPEKKGRVKSAQFFLFGTKEGIPYEVQYLTAAEELYFYSNENSFLHSLNPGEYITELEQLKRLTIGAYGLTELPASFTNLKNLEQLNLSGNNFQKVPDILTPENFPKLHSLNLNSQQRSMIYDLSNTVQKDFGGLYDEPEFPRHLLEWEKLDTLIISVNYLQGSLPTMDDYVKYTEEDIIAADTLPRELIGIPKVLPNMKHLAINLNRLTGEVPKWLLFHPALDWWIPYTFIFTQEGKDEAGNLAGFSNEPPSLNYYYNFYKGYKNNNVVEGEDEVSGTIK